MKLSIIMPVYNEENTIIKILEKVKNLNLDKEVIIVDDCSKDKTRDILKNISDNNIKIFFHEKNQGKGAAIRTGLKHAIGDVIVIQDADLEYDPNEFYKMLDIIKDGEYEVVYGSRFLGKDQSLKAMHLHYFGNKFLSFVTSVLYLHKITDMETCYKMFTRGAIEGIKLKAKGFDIEPEITTKILKRGYKIKEIPIKYNYRTYFQGKKIKIKDGIKAFYYLFKYRVFN